MRRWLAPFLAGVAVLALGVLLAFAEQSDPTDPPEPGEPHSPEVVTPVALAPFGALTGEVTRGPTCPGPVRDGQVCEEATINIRDQSGQAIAHLQSDLAGRFFVPLPPGVYTVEATRPQVRQPARRFEVPRVSPEQVTVSSGAVEQVTVRIDTGIR
jgi:hypothetical protein